MLPVFVVYESQRDRSSKPMKIAEAVTPSIPVNNMAEQVRADRSVQNPYIGILK